MTNCLFYNSKTGDGAVGDLTRDAFKTTRSFGSGAFATNWSHIEQTTRGILFYNEKDGSAAIGSLGEGDFKSLSENSYSEEAD